MAAAAAAADRSHIVHPFAVDTDDHCESPLEAYADAAPLLNALAEELGVGPAELRIYDPYYCAGSMKVGTSKQGTSNWQAGYGAGRCCASRCCAGRCCAGRILPLPPCSLAARRPPTRHSPANAPFALQRAIRRPTRQPPFSCGPCPCPPALPTATHPLPSARCSPPHP
jgi:hypothetical protein